jgi:hypothetical protein
MGLRKARGRGLSSEDQVYPARNPGLGEARR